MTGPKLTHYVFNIYVNWLDVTHDASLENQHCLQNRLIDHDLLTKTTIILPLSLHV